MSTLRGPDGGNQQLETESDTELMAPISSQTKEVLEIPKKRSSKCNLSQKFLRRENKKHRSFDPLLLSLVTSIRSQRERPVFLLNIYGTGIFTIIHLH